MPAPKYCLVTGRWLRAVIDSTEDPDREPQIVPISGVKIDIAVDLKDGKVIAPLAEPPAVLVADSYKCTSDATGQLVSPDGDVGVYVPATDDPNLRPTGFTWTATITTPGISTYKVTFHAPSDGHVDLATLVPVPLNPGTEISEWQAIVTQTTTARDEAVAAVTQLLSIRGVAGGLAALDDDGDVIDAAGNKITGGGGGGGGSVTASQITDATTVGRAVLTATSAAAARSAIGAGTSTLTIGTTSSTAAAGNHTHTPESIGAAEESHTHTAAQISDASSVGRAVLTAATAAAARTALGTGAPVQIVSQAAYDALTPDTGTLYVIREV